MNRTFHDQLDGRQHCRGNLALFFPKTRAKRDADKAKALCAGCPFRWPCLRYALAYDLAGIWGGLTQTERRTAQRLGGVHPIPVQIPNALTGARRNRFPSQ